MTKKKEQKGIKVEDIKSVKFNIELNIPKEQFDELLRRMAHLEQNQDSTNKEPIKKDAKEE